MSHKAKMIGFRSARAGLLGAGLCALLLASPADATTRVTVNADICNWSTADNAPVTAQYYNSGIHNLSSDIGRSLDVWCAIPWTVPVDANGNSTSAPRPIWMRYAGNDGDATGGIPPTCRTIVKDSTQTTVFNFGDRSSDVGFGPWVIDIQDNGPTVLESYTFAAECTVPANSDLYNMSLGVNDPCTSNNECETDQACLGGFCRDHCNTTSDCLSGTCQSNFCR